MSFLINLNRNTLISLLWFCIAKACGLLSILAMLVDKRIAIFTGCMWGISIVLSIIYAINAWSEVKN